MVLRESNFENKDKSYVNETGIPLESFQKVADKLFDESMKVKKDNLQELLIEKQPLPQRTAWAAKKSVMER